MMDPPSPEAMEDRGESFGILLRQGYVGQGLPRINIEEATGTS